MRWKKATQIFIAVSILVWIGWDVFVLVDGGTESSISHVLIEWAYKYPILPFIMGYIMGHLTWRMRQTRSLDKHSETRE